MGKLFNLKEWLTVADAARRLSIVFGEDVTEADVLRLALDGRLRLSVYFVNGVWAACGKEVHLTDSEWACWKDGINKRRFSLYDAPLRLDGGRFLKLDGGVKRISGVWDLSMVANERREVEQRFQSLTNGPKVKLKSLVSAIVERPEDGVMGMLNVTGHERLATVDADAGLPDDGVLVVRTEALRQFEQSINGAPATADKPMTTTERAHVSDQLALANQAALKWWGNADRDDRGTHPSNAEVAAWLVERGFTQTLADKAATIIRPKWAPAGRKPEE